MSKEWTTLGFCSLVPFPLSISSLFYYSITSFQFLSVLLIVNTQSPCWNFLQAIAFTLNLSFLFKKRDSIATTFEQVKWLLSTTQSGSSLNWTFQKAWLEVANRNISSRLALAQQTGLWVYFTGTFSNFNWKLIALNVNDVLVFKPENKSPIESWSKTRTSGWNLIQNPVGICNLYNLAGTTLQ